MPSVAILGALCDFILRGMIVYFRSLGAAVWISMASGGVRFGAVPKKARRRVRRGTIPLYGGIESLVNVKYPPYMGEVPPLVCAIGKEKTPAL